jgi:hypothetical protein
MIPRSLRSRLLAAPIGCGLLALACGDSRHFLGQSLGGNDGGAGMTGTGGGSGGGGSVPDAALYDAAASDVDGLSPSSCAGPPATLSLGPYPGFDSVVNRADYAYRGVVEAINMAPAVCGPSPPGTTIVQDTFRIDEVVWDNGNLGAAVGTSVAIDDQSFAVGQELLFLGAGGGRSYTTGCIGLGTVGFLDLSRYPNAATDMARLHAFLPDQADYDQLIAAEVVADATVTGLGPQVPPTVGSGASTYFVDLNISLSRTLCGSATTPVSARYVGIGDQGVYNPAGRSPPPVGTRFIVLLGAPTTTAGYAPADYDLLAVFPMVDQSSLPGSLTVDQWWSRFSSLLASPPMLSL